MTKKFLTLFIAVVCSITLFAQQKIENCPFKGRENCTGFCGRFIDGNKDGYCDYSKLTDNRNLQSDKEKDTKARAEKKRNHHKAVKKDSTQNSQQSIQCKQTTKHECNKDNQSCNKEMKTKQECCKENKTACEGKHSSCNKKNTTNKE